MSSCSLCLLLPKCGLLQRLVKSPKDWWTEDISELDIDLFRCIITTVRSANMLPLQLIGEALHVYTCCWLPDIMRTSPAESSESQSEELLDRKRRILVSIESMIPEQRGSVSVRYLLRLSSMVKFLGVSPEIKAELIKRSNLQLEEAALNDLLLAFHSSSGEDRHFYDINLVGAVLESYLRKWKRQSTAEGKQDGQSITKVGKLIDSYLEVIAGMYIRQYRSICGLQKLYLKLQGLTMMTLTGLITFILSLFSLLDDLY